MKAATIRNYGGPEVIKIEEVSQPEPKAGQVLVRVYASTVTAGAVLARRGSHPEIKALKPLLRLFFGLFRPRKPISGYEFAGKVEALGEGVTDYHIGDRVFGTTTGLKQGSYAQYLCVPVSWKQGVMEKLPETLTYEQGAALPVGAMTAHDLLRKVTITKETKLLVYGASGSVGTYMLQLAKYRGAKVTAVCSHKNMGLVKSLGADVVLDYRSEAYKSSKASFDVVVDAVGKMTKADRKRFKKQDGTLITIATPTKERTEGIKEMLNLVVKKDLQVVIDKTYTLDDLQAAHAYAETGHKIGNVVISIK